MNDLILFKAWDVLLNFYHWHLVNQMWEVLSRDMPKFGRRILPNVRLGLAQQHVTIWPTFSQTSLTIRHHL